MKQAALSIEQLAIGSRHTVVARGLNAELGHGSMTCLLGANGVGKSTLLRTLAGFQPPLEGHIYLEGHDVRSISRRQRARQVAVVLTQRADATGLTVEELVGLGRSPYTGFWGTLGDTDRDVVQRALLLTGIGGLEHRRADSLSDGEQQKVMIAKAIAQQTPVILLDEPTSFLDFNSRIELLLLLSRLAHEEQKTILLSSHDVQLAMQLADRLWLLSDSHQLTVGTPRQLADSGALGTMLQRDNVEFNPHDFTLRVHNVPQEAGKGPERVSEGKEY